MRRILLSGLLAFSAVGSVNAQQATGASAEIAKNEVMQLEKDKVPLLLKGGPAFADYFDRVDADEVVIIHGDGSTVTKATHVANWRSRTRKQLANDQHDHHVYVYDGGNVVIVTYVGTTKNSDTDGNVSTSTVRCADTWMKQDGKWLRVVHANTDLRTQ
jgi:ketosteroid isomerase-like protein